MSATGKSEPSTARVMTAMGFAVLALAFSSIFIKKLELKEIAPLAIALYRMAIATALLLPAAVMLRRKEMSRLTARDAGLLVLGGFFLALHFGAWITSLKYISIATSVVLVNSHPLFVVLASYLFLDEKPSRGSLTGTAIGLAGMAVISRDGLEDVEFALLGNALAILGALAVVGYFIVGRKVRARVSLLGYVTPLYGACSLFLLFWAIAAGSFLGPFEVDVWAYFAALAVVPTILGHTVFNWAIKHVRPSAVSLAFLGEPVVAAALAFIFFDQRPPLSTFIGGALVLAGVYLATSSNPKAKIEKPEPKSVIIDGTRHGRR
ncbi:MAG TPA: DMT family transporter [Blastocatellia bacterium]|nr:DMT family transporter [Blastocatellia bacterium]